MKRDSGGERPSEAASDMLPKSVVFEPYAFNLIKAYFGWNISGPWSDNEQICALGGEARGNRIIVKAALPLLCASSSASHVKVTGEIWMLAIWMLSDMRMELIGSIHSHPHELGIFLSHADIETHRLMFPGGVSAVINPQRIIGAFNRDGGKVSIRLPDKKLKGMNTTIPKSSVIMYNGS